MIRHFMLVVLAALAVGSFSGSFANTPAHDLGAAVLEALVERDEEVGRGSGPEKGNPRSLLDGSAGVGNGRQRNVETARRRPGEGDGTSRANDRGLYGGHRDSGSLRCRGHRDRCAEGAASAEGAA